jgi:hypothetical protein
LGDASAAFGAAAGPAFGVAGLFVILPAAHFLFESDSTPGRCMGPLFLCYRSININTNKR